MDPYVRSSAWLALTTHYLPEVFQSSNISTLLNYIFGYRKIISTKGKLSFFCIFQYIINPIVLFITRLFSDISLVLIATELKNQEKIKNCYTSSIVFLSINIIFTIIDAILNQKLHKLLSFNMSEFFTIQHVFDNINSQAKFTKKVSGGANTP